MWLSVRARIWLLLAALTLILSVGCTSLPSLDDRQASYALPHDEAIATPMGRAIAPMASKHPELSGIYALSNPHEAFAVRALLANAAERTLDVQYYIWRNDLTGILLLDSLRQAADRGVRVRFLLDDSANASIEPVLAALDAHPNIEVRLFNPLAIRSPRWINYIVDFSRVNRRMHNKSFTADNQATIIGGRNVGDEYFGATQDVLFSDLDVLAVGNVVQDVSDDFDRYWNSDSAYPARTLLPDPEPGELKRLAEKAVSTATGTNARTFVTALQKTSLVHDLLNDNIELEWAPTLMLSDDPRKALGKLVPQDTVAYDLHRYFGNPKYHLDLVSSYFVPTKLGADFLIKLANEGIAVRILTNSLAATDVPAVHAGYEKWRKPLLKAGIEIYETRPNENGGHDNGKNAGSDRRAGSGSGPGPFGSSGSSLHAKTLSIDDERVFVGSFNFDPRSAALNTELGFVIDSPALSHNIHEAFMGRVPETTYKVHLSENNKIYWSEYDSNGSVIRYNTEPHSGLWRRVWVGFLSFLPIDWML